MESLNLVRFWLVLLLVKSCYTNSTIADYTDKDLDFCKLNRDVGFKVGTRCCKIYAENFSQNWAKEGHYLTEYLATIKAWGCPQYKSECQRPSLNFTKFARLVYKQSCNQSQFVSTCKSSVLRVTNQPADTKGSSWADTLSNLRKISLTVGQLRDPCVEVALYSAVSEARNSSYGYYHEIKRDFLPFCGVSWCGVDSQHMHDRWITAWLCMSPECQNNVIAIVVVCSLLALVGFIENAISIAVFVRNAKLRDSQGVFRLSLAVSDFLCAAIVFPTFANSLYRVSTSREEMGPPIGGSSLLPPNGRYDSIARRPGGDAWAHLDQPYLYFVGFFTSIYITITIYTLLVASLERIRFSRQYLAYSKGDAKAFAVKSVAAVWLASIVVALPSLFVNRYSLIASVMVLSSGETALYLYVIAYLIPLILMWALSLTSLCLSAKIDRRPHNNACVRISNELQNDISQEVYASRTLNIVVATFSATVILGSISAIASFVEGEGTGLASMELVAIMFLVSNCLWNFLTYLGRDVAFRSAIFCRRHADQSQPNAGRRTYAQMDKLDGSQRTTSQESCSTSPI